MGGLTTGLGALAALILVLLCRPSTGDTSQLQPYTYWFGESDGEEVAIAPLLIYNRVYSMAVWWEGAPHMIERSSGLTNLHIRTPGGPASSPTSGFLVKPGGSAQTGLVPPGDVINIEVSGATFGSPLIPTNRQQCMSSHNVYQTFYTNLDPGPCASGAWSHDMNYFPSDGRLTFSATGQNLKVEVVNGVPVLRASASGFTEVRFFEQIPCFRSGPDPHVWLDAFGLDCSQAITCNRKNGVCLEVTCTGRYGHGKCTRCKIPWTGENCDVCESPYIVDHAGRCVTPNPPRSPTTSPTYSCTEKCGPGALPDQTQTTCKWTGECACEDPDATDDMDWQLHTEPLQCCLYGKDDVYSDCNLDDCGCYGPGTVPGSCETHKRCLCFPSFSGPLCNECADTTCGTYSLPYDCDVGEACPCLDGAFGGTCDDFDLFGTGSAMSEAQLDAYCQPLLDMEEWQRCECGRVFNALTGNCTAPAEVEDAEFVCREGLTVAGDECVLLVDAEASFGAAKYACESVGMYPATGQPEAVPALRALMAANGVSDIWLFFYWALVQEPTVLPVWGTGADFDSDNTLYAPGAEAQAFIEGSYSCLKLSAGDGLWHASLCGANATIVCQEPRLLAQCDPGLEFDVLNGFCVPLAETDPTCDSAGGWFALPGNLTRCARASTSAASFVNAKQQCTQLAGELASVLGEDERDTLLAAGGNSYWPRWIGLNYSGDVKYFEDGFDAVGVTPTCTFGGAACGTGTWTCAALAQSGAYNLLPCEASQRYFCTRSPRLCPPAMTLSGGKCVRSVGSLFSSYTGEVVCAERALKSGNAVQAAKGAALLDANAVCMQAHSGFGAADAWPAQLRTLAGISADLLRDEYFGNMATPILADPSLSVPELFNSSDVFFYASTLTIVSALEQFGPGPGNYRTLPLTANVGAFLQFNSRAFTACGRAPCKCGEMRATGGNCVAVSNPAWLLELYMGYARCGLLSLDVLRERVTLVPPEEFISAALYCLATADGAADTVTAALAEVSDIILVIEEAGGSTARTRKLSGLASKLLQFQTLAPPTANAVPAFAATVTRSDLINFAARLKSRTGFALQQEIANVLENNLAEDLRAMGEALEERLIEIQEQNDNLLDAMADLAVATAGGFAEVHNGFAADAAVATLQQGFELDAVREKMSEIQGRADGALVEIQIWTERLQTALNGGIGPTIVTMIDLKRRFDEQVEVFNEAQRELEAKTAVFTSVLQIAQVGLALGSMLGGPVGMAAMGGGVFLGGTAGASVGGRRELLASFGAEMELKRLAGRRGLGGGICPFGKKKEEDTRTTIERMDLGGDTNPAFKRPKGKVVKAASSTWETVKIKTQPARDSYFRLAAGPDAALSLAAKVAALTGLGLAGFAFNQNYGPGKKDSPELQGINDIRTLLKDDFPSCFFPVDVFDCSFSGASAIVSCCRDWRRNETDNSSATCALGAVSDADFSCTRLFWASDPSVFDVTTHPPDPNGYKQHVIALGGPFLFSPVTNNVKLSCNSDSCDYNKLKAMWDSKLQALVSPGRRALAQVLAVDSRRALCPGPEETPREKPAPQTPRPSGRQQAPRAPRRALSTRSSRGKNLGRGAGAAAGMAVAFTMASNLFGPRSRAPILPLPDVVSPQQFAASMAMLDEILGRIWTAVSELTQDYMRLMFNSEYEAEGDVVAETGSAAAHPALWDSLYHEIQDLLEFDMDLCPKLTPEADTEARRLLLARQFGMPVPAKPMRRALRSKKELEAAMDAAEAEIEVIRGNFTQQQAVLRRECGHFRGALKQVTTWAKALHETFLELVDAGRRSRIITASIGALNDREEQAQASMERALMDGDELAARMRMKEPIRGKSFTRRTLLEDLQASIHASALQEGTLEMGFVAQQRLTDFCASMAYVSPGLVAAGQALASTCEVRRSAGGNYRALALQEIYESMEDAADALTTDVRTTYVRYGREKAVSVVLDVTELIDFDVLVSSGTGAFSLAGPFGGQTLRTGTNASAAFARGGPFFCTETVKLDNLELDSVAIIFYDEAGNVLGPAASEGRDVRVEMSLTGPFVKSWLGTPYIFEMAAYDQLSATYHVPRGDDVCADAIVVLGDRICRGAVQGQTDVDVRPRPSPYAHWNFEVTAGRSYLRNAYSVKIVADLVGVRNDDLICRPETSSYRIDPGPRTPTASGDDGDADATQLPLVAIVVGLLAAVVVVAAAFFIRRRRAAASTNTTVGVFKPTPPPMELHSSNPAFRDTA